MQLPLATQFNELTDKNLSVENCVNLCAVSAPNARNAYYLKTIHGFKAFYRGADIRAAATLDGDLYVVSGRRFQLIRRDGSAVDLGVIQSDTDVQIASNGFTLFIVDGVNGYTYSPTQGLLAVTDPDYRPADTVTTIGGRFVFNSRFENGQFFYSDTYSTDIDGLSFATAENSPDDLLAVLGDQSLIAFGSDTIQFWSQDAEGFLPIAGATQQLGLKTVASIAREGGSVFFQASDNTIRVMQGYQPVRISTEAIEQNLTDVTSAFAYTFEGSLFYQINTQQRSWCYDQRTGLWHERRTALSKSRYTGYVNAYGKHLMLSKDGIFEADGEEYTEDGAAIVKELTTPFVHDDGNGGRVAQSRVQLMLRTGIKLAETPEVMMSYTDDGYSWSNEAWVSAGLKGQVKTMAEWRRLGQFYQRAYRFRITDNVPVAVWGLNGHVR